MRRSTNSPLRGLRALVRRAMAEWQVPGLAVAVVKGGRTIFLEGFGLRDVRKKLEAAPDTLFPIGSVTKAFTATALGILVDEKTLTWDTPVRDVLSGFRLHDPMATRRATVRDLLCHRTGLPRHDNAWYALAVPRRELMKRLRHLKPSKDFRACWQYQNLMYMVAGLIVEEAAERTWEQFVAERLLEPLGMTGATCSPAEARATGKLARPYKRKGRRAVGTPLNDLGPLAPAGGLIASAADMTHWLKLNLSGGTRGRRRIVSSGTLAEIHAPQVVVPEPPKWPDLLHQTYALGWEVLPYRGHVALTHGGLVNGFQAGIGLLPRARAGVVVLTNLMAQLVPRVVMYYVFDRLLGLRPAPWLSRMREQTAAELRAQATSKRKAGRASVGSPKRPRPLRHYAGCYEHPGYGSITIRLTDGRLRALWHGIDHALRHCRGDVFAMLRPLWDAQSELCFLADARGRIDRLSVPFESATKPIVFPLVKPSRR